MTQNQVLTEDQYRQAAAIQNVVTAVQRETDRMLDGLDSALQPGPFTRDLASDLSRVNMLHPALARTSVVRSIKEYFREISAPIIQTMFRATDSRPLKHGSRGPRA